MPNYNKLKFIITVFIKFIIKPDDRLLKLMKNKRDRILFFFVLLRFIQLMFFVNKLCNF